MSSVSNQPSQLDLYLRFAQDVPLAMALFVKIKGAIADLPPKETRTVEDIARAAASVLPDIGHLIDVVEGQIHSSP
jgi:hypothetical protein